MPAGLSPATLLRIAARDEPALSEITMVSDGQPSSALTHLKRGRDALKISWTEGDAKADDITATLVASGCRQAAVRQEPATPRPPQPVLTPRCRRPRKPAKTGS